MSTWIGSLFGSAKPGQPAVSVDEEVQIAHEETANASASLQDRYDKNQRMIAQLEAQVRQLGNTPSGREAFTTMTALQREQALLGGKIRTLNEVGSGVRDMQSNVVVHGAMTKANAASGRIAEQLDTKTVRKTMDTTRKHTQQQKAISEQLSGASFLDPVDPDEMEAEMSAFLNQGNSVGVSDSFMYDMPVPPQTRRPVAAAAVAIPRAVPVAASVSEQERYRQNMIAQKLAMQQKQQIRKK